MKITRNLLDGFGPFYLCQGRNKYPYAWSSDAGRAFDLSTADALSLAKRLKLVVVVADLDCLHVVGIRAFDEVNEVEAVRLYLDPSDRVDDATLGGEPLPLSGGIEKVFHSLLDLLSSEEKSYVVQYLARGDIHTAWMHLERAKDQRAGGDIGAMFHEQAAREILVAMMGSMWSQGGAA